MTAGDFWSWSLERYPIEGVEPLLLRLQDEFGFNVNILLWACWCGERYDEAPALVIRKAMDVTGQWNGNVTASLRQARRYLKTPPPQADAQQAEDLRGQIKALELAAERIEQELLEKLAETALSPAPDKSQSLSRMRRNLASYAALLGAAKKKDFTVSLLESLADHIFNAAGQVSAGKERHGG